MKTGEVGILNVGAGDIRLNFDPANPAERIRAARIVADMLRRGYALLVEVEENGKKFYQRALEFREDRCEYVIADFDGSRADSPEPPIEQEAAHVEDPEPEEASPRARRGRKAVKAEHARAVAVGRSAGG